MSAKITIGSWWLPGFTAATMVATIIHPALGLLVVAVSGWVSGRLTEQAGR